ncbi:MAG TPA: CoA ester lyase [Rhizomicrobium sp.]|jgi:citrate lyase subunit beta/citryl-CoA lyase|nr:CoA ester lyase [Rhizomicrobium sp.]
MTLRSLLFVPGDSEKKLAKVAESAADALILDLEDSVAAERKTLARDTLREYLLAHPGPRARRLWVRINPLDTVEALTDLAAIIPGRPDGVVLPKAPGAQDVAVLDHYLSALEVSEGLPRGGIKVVVIATETGAAMFGLGTYSKSTPRLAGLTWGAEDLAAAVGASSNSDESGERTLLYRMARALCLAAAAAAEVEPIDGAHMGIGDSAGLKRVCDEARRDGFRGKLAIHPDQVEIINQAFSPTEAEIAHARRVCDLFAANPGAGTLQLEGRMLDIPHLKQARRVLALADELRHGSR